uniref:Uncharacterized protein n=1 Tax=Arundo donax TaxID=35708 RepID=A0A0A8Y5C0_ARUDO
MATRNRAKQMKQSTGSAAVKMIPVPADEAAVTPKAARFRRAKAAACLIRHRALQVQLEVSVLPLPVRQTPAVIRFTPATARTDKTKATAAPKSPEPAATGKQLRASPTATTVARRPAVIAQCEPPVVAAVPMSPPAPPRRRRRRCRLASLPTP